jgi:peroxiredoxin
MSLPFDLRLLAVPAIVACIAAEPAVAQEQTLKVGSNAPALTVDFVQGDAVDLSNPNMTFVVEFWATWCGPCKKSIPHLNDLYGRYRSKGLVIVGVSGEPAGTVKPFLAKQGSGMSYPVACDREKKTDQDWMQAAKQSGIPCAFIVRGGKILWIGHPLDKKFDEVVVASLAGRYNPELSRKAEPMLKAASSAVSKRNFQDAYKHFDAVLALDATTFGDVAVRKYRTLLLDANDAAGAKAWGAAMLATHANDPTTLAELATFITTDTSIADRDLDLAVAAAEAASAALARGSAGNPEGLALQAEVLFRAGRVDEAQELQLRAWMAAEPADKNAYKRTLDTYKKAASKAKAGG